MSQRQLRWKGPQAPRAKPIAPENWEAHKEQLCDLYQKMSLEDLIVTMKERHQFTPSRPQYVSQFNKWGFRKYNKGSRRVVRAEEHTPPPIGSSLLGECERAEAGYASQPNCSSMNPRRKGRPAVPPKNREKLSDFITKRSSADPASASDRIAPSPQGFENLVSSDRKRNTPDWTAPPRLCGSDVDIGFASSHNIPEREADSETPNHVTRNDDNHLYIQESSDKMVTDMQDIPSQGRRPPSETDQLGRHVDFLPLTDSFGPGKIQNIKLAADFLFWAQCYADSFELYVQLLKETRQAPHLLGSTAMSAIIGCACSSVSASQIEISLNLVRQKLSERPVYAEDNAETFLYQSILEELYQKQGNEDMAKVQHLLAMRSSFVQQRSLDHLTTGDRALGLVVYRYLNRALTSEGHFMAARSVKDQLLHLKPGPFGFECGNMRSTSTRSCLHWCIGELQRRSEFCNCHIDLRHLGRDTGRIEFLGVYSDLWDRWRRRQTVPGDEGVTFWAEQVEQSTGISPAEFLATVCVMMLKNVPASRAVGLRMTFGPIYSDVNEIPLRALSGAKELWEFSDRKLAAAFITANSDINAARAAEPTKDEEAFNSVVRGHVRSFLKLPGVPEAEQHEPGALTRCQAADFIAPSRVSAILPTLASSLHSSDLSSLRALRDRIQEDIGNLIRDAGMTPPSRVIRSASMSSLSLMSSILPEGSRSLFSLPLSTAARTQVAGDSEMVPPALGTEPPT